MPDLGRLCLAVGGALVVVGLLFVLAGRIGLPLGRLPGDLAWRGRNTTVFFPIMTSLVLSVLLSFLSGLSAAYASRAQAFAGRHRNPTSVGTGTADNGARLRSVCLTRTRFRRLSLA